MARKNGKDGKSAGSEKSLESDKTTEAQPQAAWPDHPPSFAGWARAAIAGTGTAPSLSPHLHPVLPPAAPGIVTVEPGQSVNLAAIDPDATGGLEKAAAKAELDAQYKPSAKATAKVLEAKADAAYDTAKQKCDALAGNTKDVCMKDAKAAHVAAMADAKRS